jgi:hypothetical protein
MISSPFVALAFYVYKIGIKKKRPLFKVLALLPLLLLSYFWFSYFFPGDRIYKSDFKEVTGIDFPKHGSIFCPKGDEFADPHGDYTSEFIAKVGATVYYTLPEKLTKKGFKLKPFEEIKDDGKTFQECMAGKKVIKAYWFVEYQNNPRSYYVGFLSDHETLLISRSSW